MMIPLKHRTTAQRLRHTRYFQFTVIDNTEWQNN